MTATVNEIADRIVRTDVHLCLSSVVSALASAWDVDHVSEDMDQLHEQAQELAFPVLDYEEAARGAGWKYHDMSGRWHKVLGAQMPSQDTAQDVCEQSGLDPYEREVYEHWAVSTWLAEKLQSQGEKVDTDFAGLNVWARTTTGQAISMDAVIQRIASDVASAV